MALRDRLESIIAQFESDFTNKKDVKPTEDLFTKSAEDIVDGLMNKYDGSEQRALDALNAHLNKADDGYKDRNPQVYDAKKKLEKLINEKKESTNESSSRFKKIVNEALEKALKEWGNYPDGYNWRNNPFENEDEGYEQALDTLEKGYAVKLIKGLNGQPLLSPNGKPLDDRYGVMYLDIDDSTGEAEFIENNVLTSEDSIANVFKSQEEAKAFGDQFKMSHPQGEYQVVEVYNKDSAQNPELWYSNPEDAYPYDEYLSDNEGMDYYTEASDDEKPERAARDSFVWDKRDSANVEEMLMYARNGIHPYCDYKKPMWRFLDGDEKRVVVLDGIDAERDKVYVYFRPVEIIRTKMGKAMKKFGELEAMPAKQFREIIHSPLNKDILAHIMKGESKNPNDWIDAINKSKTNQRNQFADWYEKNKEYYDFDDFDKIAIQKIYVDITKNGYSPQEAIARHEKERKIDDVEESFDLTEAPAYKMSDLITKPRELRPILQQLGINDDAVDVPLTKSYPDMGDDTEPPFKFRIVAAPKGPIENITQLFVKDWDKGGRAFPMDVKEIREIADREENQNPEFDLWDLASTPNKQSRALNTGTQGHWEELTKDNIIAALSEMENDERYKGVKLVDKYLAPQSFEKRNPLVIRALRDFEPSVAIKPIRNRLAHNGISYQYFVPEEGNPNAQPPSYNRKNPYKDLKKYYW